jgi:molecular chaperone GrpE (heat shock protein)
VEQKGVEDETVVDELKKGYWIDDKLLRPSQVVVSKKKEKQEEKKEC